jgi:hypothetical protein
MELRLRLHTRLVWTGLTMLILVGGSSTFSGPQAGPHMISKSLAETVVAWLDLLLQLEKSLLFLPVVPEAWKHQAA